MFIEHTLKLACIATPKTGSTSMHYALMAALNKKFFFHSVAPDLYHMTARDLELVLGADRMKRYFVFSISRNPYDRMVSLFHDFKYARNAIKVDRFDRFVLERLEANWMQNVHFKPQSFFLDFEGRRIVDHVYKFEEGLGPIMEQVGARAGFTPITPGKSRTSNRSAWQDYFDKPEMLAVINRLYAEDFERLGYEQVASV